MPPKTVEIIAQCLDPSSPFSGVGSSGGSPARILSSLYMYCNTARSFLRLTLWIASPARSLVAMANLKHMAYHMASILASMVSCPLVAWIVNPDFWYFHSHCCCNGHAAEQQNQHGSPCLPPSIGPQGEHGEKRQMQYFNTQWLVGRCWKKACQLSWVVARLAYCCIARAYPVYSNVAIYSIQKQTGRFPDASRSEISSSRKPARLIFAMPELIWVKRQDLQAIKALKTRKASCWAWLEARGTEHCLNTSDEECQAARKTMSFKMPNVFVTCCYVCHAFLWCFAFWQWGNDTDTCEQKDLLILNACEDLVLSIGSIYK